MLINHDTRCALDIVVALLNTDAGDGGQEADALVDVGALQGFVDEHGISGLEALCRSDVAAVRAVRNDLSAVFAATDDRAAAERLNAIVAAAGTTPQLTDHDGYEWHVHYFAPGASVAEHLAADGGMALAFLVVAGERERLRRCEAPDCGRAFVDYSRNRSRRYCSSRTCGNRLHVAAYRARQREAAAQNGAGNGAGNGADSGAGKAAAGAAGGAALTSR
ncbi:CGNR zinc finger domain-containing protein [Streptomyces aculeolatus]|uniref:CGNR zinc finger domain-containing protein n=1 Tax=Streptomyces aculeolatus TaxID=270689 RepID=UPI001CEDF7B7|nr:CGNR zinc finger domain-containing protein [Streptomyces aculeolatus]